MKKPRFYKPQWELIVLDLVIWTLATLIMVLWRTLTDKSRHVDYCLVCTALFVANLIFGYCFNKYCFLRDHGYFYNMKGTTYVRCAYFGSCGGFLYQRTWGTFQLCANYDGSYSLCFQCWLSVFITATAMR